MKEQNSKFNRSNNKTPFIFFSFYRDLNFIKYSVNDEGYLNNFLSYLNENRLLTIRKIFT
jgi:hypothetical protein